jgi:two-component system OmpR family sensor kinase
MSAIAFLRRRPLEVIWVAFATAILVGMALSHELWEVPLLLLMFLAMVWHSRRRQAALRSSEGLARERSDLLERQERLLHDVSHELRTPVTIARGHLDLLRRDGADPGPEVTVALDELDRMARLVDRLMLLAKAERADFVELAEVDLQSFLEDVFVRWSELAPRGWRLGSVIPGTVHADRHALRIALDALLENAVAYTVTGERIELAANASDGFVTIAVADGGQGIPDEALGRIFERFGRVGPSRTRREGGAGLGLAIVDAIARAHAGECGVEASPGGSTFFLRLPGFSPARSIPALPGHTGALPSR